MKFEVILIGSIRNLPIFIYEELKANFDNSMYWYFYAPLEKGGILFCNYRTVSMSVSRSVGRSVRDDSTIPVGPPGGPKIMLAAPQKLWQN